nr:hypothetical protein [Pseudomonas toyotomiensis]
MITLAMARWTISLIHSSPIPGFFLEQGNRHNFYMDMVAMYNRDLIADVGYEGAAHTEYSNNDETYISWVTQAFITVPCLRLELEDPNGEFMLYIREVDRNHTRTLALSNPQVLLSLLDILNVPSVASKIVDYLNVKDAASLGSTTKQVRASIGYDPFKGHNRHEMLGSTSHLFNNSRKDLIEALALHAFNNIYDVIQPHIKKGGLSRRLDLQVKNISTRTTFGKYARPLIATNCLALTTTASGETEGAVNFIFNDRQALLDNSELHLRAGDYDRTSNMHAELRLMERQHDRGIFRPIYVDKLCCPFCAVQFIAMGLISFTPGAVNNTLAWYTFTPYIIYFKSRRARMWGQDIESKFSQLTPSEKSYFLYKLALACSLTKHNVPIPMYRINF